MRKRMLALLLALCLLPMCGFAEADNEYLAELQLLNEYMRTAGENTSVGIEKICDQIEGNGRIGEYTVEFGIYANVLRLLEAEDYSGALSEAGDLLNSSSFEKFRAYLEDGEELRSWGLYALDTVERLYSYVQGRASEAKDDWKKAAQYYSACEQFMDARERKQFAGQVTPSPSPSPTPTPTPTPSPSPTPTLSLSGSYRLFPEIKPDTAPDEAAQILKNQYGFDEVKADVIDGGWHYELGKGMYLGVPISFGTIDVRSNDSGGDFWDDTVFFEDGEACFNAMLIFLNQTIGKPDYGTIELYEFGSSEFKAGKGRHELRHLTENELRSGTFSSAIASSRLTAAEDVEINIYWGDLLLYISGTSERAAACWLDAWANAYPEYEREVFEGE